MTKRFLDHWGDLSAKAKRRLAAGVGNSPEYLRLVAYGHRRASADLAVRLEKATAGGVKRADLRPDIFSA